MGILDIFLDIPKTLQNAMCCAATRSQKEDPLAFKKTKSLASMQMGSRPPSNNKPSMCGVGLVFQDKHKDGLYVSSLVKGGPAFHSHKIFVGDILVEIDGMDVSSLSVNELGPYLVGEPGTSVQLAFRRGASNVSVDLVRAFASRDPETDLTEKVDGKVVCGVKKTARLQSMTGSTTASTASTFTSYRQNLMSTRVSDQ